MACLQRSISCGTLSQSTVDVACCCLALTHSCCMSCVAARPCRPQLPNLHRFMFIHIALKQWQAQEMQPWLQSSPFAKFQATLHMMLWHAEASSHWQGKP